MKRHVTLGCGLAAGLVLMLGLGREGRAAGYDPLAIGTAGVTHLDLSAHDSARNRDLPLRIYLPATTVPAPVILFSHGLGGSRTGSAFLGEHWAARGYAVVYVQHPGSDESVWKQAEPGTGLQALKRAASLEQFLLRVQDVPAVLDQLEAWTKAKSHPLAGRLDLKRVGMSGHSFGALTTQAVSGQALPASSRRFTDARIQAALVLSPGAPLMGRPERAFGSVTIPWLLMTGTKDAAPISNQDAASRRTVYPALSGGPKYELVLDNAEHSVFTERALPGDHEPRNPNHHRVILALSTAFWDAYLRQDAQALAWLKGPGPRQVMQPADQWQFSTPEPSAQPAK